MPHTSALNRLTAGVLLVSGMVLPLPALAGLVARWGFDGCSTTDDSGANRHLTAAGAPTCVAGPVVGDAWQLDGATQYLERTGDASFSPGSRAWSVAAWVRSDGDTNRWDAIVTWYRCGANPACSGSFDAALWWLHNNRGRPGWWVRDDSGVGAVLEDPSPTLADGGWHHLVGTLSAAHDSLELWVDGVRRLAQAVALGTVSGAFVPLEVGRIYRTGWGLPSDYFQGAVDEVHIYDHKLTPGEIAGLHASQPLAVPTVTATTLAIERVTPNPMRGMHLSVGITLHDRTPARLVMLDLLGRQVAAREIAAPAPGRQDLVLNAPRAFPSGVYFLRLVQGRESASRRVTILH